MPAPRLPAVGRHVVRRRDPVRLPRPALHARWPMFVRARPGPDPDAGTGQPATCRRERPVGLGLDGGSAHARLRRSSGHPVGGRRGVGMRRRHGTPRRPVRAADRQFARSVARDVPPQRPHRNARSRREPDHDDGRRGGGGRPREPPHGRRSSVPSSIRVRRACGRRSTGGRTSSTTRRAITSCTSASRRSAPRPTARPTIRRPPT